MITKERKVNEMNLLKGILICMIIVFVAGGMAWAYLYGVLPGMEPDPDLVEYVQNAGI